MASESFAIADLTGGQLNAIVKRLGGPEFALRLLRGELEVKEIEHLINLDASPLIPCTGWQVEEHRQGGQLKWDPAKVRLRLSPDQQNGKVVKGHQLRKELAEQPVLNANLLDYLIDRPHLIPDNWKQDEQGRTIFIYFWGTIYRASGSRLCVRYLCWGEGRWRAGYGWPSDDWFGQFPAAVLASLPAQAG